MRARMRFGPLKRSCSSINLMQVGCPEHCEPPLIINTHRSCGSSPVRSRPHHGHEIYDLEQSGVACTCSLSEQMISHTTSRPLTRSRSQNFCPTGYFNALDVATGIRNALHGYRQGGACMSSNRTIQRFDLRPTPMLHNSSNLENCDVGTTCVEDISVGLGLATVLCPKVSHEVGFQIQRRTPRGLAAVIDPDCTCLEIGPQIGPSEPWHGTCPRPGLSLPSLQDFHQKVASSSPRNSQVITNIDMLEKFQVPTTCEFGTESVGSSRTSVRMETEVQRDPEHSCSDYNSDDFELSEPSLRTSTRWRSPLRDGQRSLDMRPVSKRKRRSSMKSPSFREPRPSSSYYTEPLREFDPDEDTLREQLQRMSFNGIRKLLPRYSSWMPSPDFDQGDPKRLSILVPAPGSQRRGSESLSISVVSEPSDVNSKQDDIELEDDRWPSSNAGGSSKTSVVSFSQSTAKPDNRDSGSGSTYSVQVSSSNDTRSDDRTNKEESRDSSESLRNMVQQAVQQAVQGELTLRRAMQKAVHQELSQRSSSFGSDESPTRSPRPSTCTSSSNDQSAYAQIVANATNKTQEVLDETRASLTSRAQSKSGPNSRTTSINNLRSGSSSFSGRSSRQLPPQARLNLKDHRTSITELLNSMNSVTQLLNSLPLEGDNDRLSIAARKPTGPQRGSKRPASRIQSPQWLKANRGSGGSFQQQRDQQQYDMGLARGSQQRSPNPRSSGQGITYNWYGSDGMPLGQGSQFSFDPKRPRSQSMPVGSQLAYGRNSSMQQSRRASGSSTLNRQSPSSNSTLQGCGIMRGCLPGIPSQRRSRLSVSGNDPNDSEMTTKSSLVFDQNEPTAYSEEIINTVISESGETVSNAIPNTYDSTYQSESPVGEFRQSQVGEFRQSQVGEFPQPQVGEFRQSQVGEYPQSQVGEYHQSQVGEYPQSQVGEYRQSQIGEYPQSQIGEYPQSQVGEFRQSQIGEFSQSVEGDDSLDPVPEETVYQSEDMGGDQQEAAYGSGQDEQFEGMTVNCQPYIHFQRLDQVLKLLQTQVRRLKGSSKNSIVTPSPTPLATTEQFDLHAITSSEIPVETNKDKTNVAPLAKPEQSQIDASSPMPRTSANMLGDTDKAEQNVAPLAKLEQFHLDSSNVMTRTSIKMLTETRAKPDGAPLTEPEHCHTKASSPMTPTLTKMLIDTDRTKPNMPPPAKSEQFDLDARNPKVKTSDEMLREIDRAKPNVAPPAKSEQFDFDASDSRAKTSEEVLREIDKAKSKVAPPAKPEQFDASNPKSISSGKMLTETRRAKPNVAQIPCEFQHNLIKMRSHTFQQLAFVKPEIYGRKSLSNTVSAMIQELEVLESRNRQKSAAYEFLKTSTQQRVLPKAIAF